MKRNETTIWALAIMAMVVVALIFGFALKASNESLAEADRTIAEADAFIEAYERDTKYDSFKEMEVKAQAQKSEQASVENEQDASFVEPVEVYVDPTTADYSTTWHNCVLAANELGMDEYSLSIMAGWLVREGYTYYDSYLALLCAYCPLHYWANGEDIAWGLSGYGTDPSYTTENLIGYSYSISQPELEILYQALTNPRYDIFCCDGVSSYPEEHILYESYVNGWLVTVWAE